MDDHSLKQIQIAQKKIERLFRRGNRYRKFALAYRKQNQALKGQLIQVRQDPSL